MGKYELGKIPVRINEGDRHAEVIHRQEQTGEKVGLA
jgi:hypothetical protein